MEADPHQLVAALKRIQELATDLPEGTLEEAQKALAEIWDDCDLTLATAVKPESDPVMCPCGKVTEQECGEALPALDGCLVPDDA